MSENTTTYYVFNANKIALIQAAFSQKKGEGFFTFTSNLKLVETTQIPTSNTDTTPINNYRNVVILETNFAEEDQDLRIAAEQNAEIYDTSNIVILEYLAKPDFIVFETRDDFPEIGDSDIKYIDNSTSITYIWENAQYTVIVNN